MNIFVLDQNPIAAARMHCDAHVCKMVVESAQMLSTAHRILDGKEGFSKSKSGKRMIKDYILPDVESVLYKAVHINHPCTKWSYQSASNYVWHYGLFRELAKEFEFRFQKVHQSWNLLGDLLLTLPKNIPNVGPTPFAKAMKAYPEIYSIQDTVDAYRKFYLTDKISFAKWNKGRSAPDWWINGAYT